MRKGIDADHLTYLEAGRIAEAEGAAAVALHARTAARASTPAPPTGPPIARLKETVTDVPVLGNGDIWSADDALRMVAETGCDGVVVGRGCLGRPWLFADLAAAFDGPRRAGAADARRRPRRAAAPPRAARRALRGGVPGGRERRGCRDIRKHMAWYLKGYAVGSETRAALGLVESLAGLDAARRRAGRRPAVPGRAGRGPARADRNAAPRVALPEGWLDSRELDGLGAGRRCEPPSSPSPVADGRPGTRPTTSCVTCRERPKQSRRGAVRARPRPGRARRGAAPAGRQDPGGRARTDDFVRNRLTHSLEVAQVARDLGRALGCDPDIVETACLAHDLGHPPFGHNGEGALDELAADVRRLRGQRADPAAADPAGGEGRRRRDGALGRAQPHPGHARRLHEVPVAARRRAAGAGSRAKFGVYADDRPVFALAARRARRRRRRCLEAQVMDLADDVAYSRARRRGRRRRRPGRPRGCSTDPSATRVVAQPCALVPADAPPTRCATTRCDRLRGMAAWPRRRTTARTGAPGRAEEPDQRPDRPLLPARPSAATRARVRRRAAACATRADLVVPRETAARDRGAQGHRGALRHAAPTTGGRSTRSSASCSPSWSAPLLAGGAGGAGAGVRADGVARRRRRRRPAARRRRPGRLADRRQRASPGTRRLVRLSAALTARADGRRRSSRACSDMDTGKALTEDREVSHLLRA